MTIEGTAEMVARNDHREVFTRMAGREPTRREESLLEINFQALRIALETQVELVLSAVADQSQGRSDH